MTQPTLQDLNKRLTVLEQGAFSTDPNVHPQTVANLNNIVKKTSINGFANGSPGTSIPSLTATLVKPTSVFANGVTFNASGSDYGFTIDTAGQYIISALVSYTSTQSGYLYQTRIQWTPSGGASTNISTVFGIGGAGSVIGVPCSIIYNLSVGDLIQLYTYQSYSGSTTIYSNTNLVYLGIAKI